MTIVPNEGESTRVVPYRGRGGVSGEIKVDREVVLRQAARLFAERGYRATNLGHVASRIGVTRQALYYHFPRKLDILLALFDRMTTFLEKGADAVASQGLPPGELFGALLESHARLVATNIDLVTILLSENAEFPEADRRVVQARRRRYTERFVDAYRRGVRAGALADRDPHIAVYTLIGAVNSMFRWYKADGTVSPSEIARITVDMLASGFVVRDTPGDQDGSARRRNRSKRKALKD